MHPPTFPNLPPGGSGPPSHAPSGNAIVPLHRPRRFFYDNTFFNEPGPQFTTRAVMEFLAQSYPELKRGSWTSAMSPEGFEDITFFKVAGEKGGGLDVTALVAALDCVPLDDIEAVRLTEEILTLEQQGQLTAETLLKMSDSIQKATEQLRTLTFHSATLRQRVLSLPPSPHPRVPLGF